MRASPSGDCAEREDWKDLEQVRTSLPTDPDHDEWVSREIVELNLQELRSSCKKSQEEVAEIVRMTQSQVSRLERREDHLLSTLRQYVEALGGRVEVVAIMGDKRVRLRGV